MPIDEPTYTHPVRHILIVDDSPIVAGAHARTLRARGHQVEVRHSQAEGFALLAERARFDVVLLDVDLEAPGAGFEIGRRFLARGLTKRLIFCTGTEDPRQALLAFLEHRHEVLVRRTRHRLGKIAQRLEVLGGYLIAFLNLDEVIRIIREEDEPKAELIRAFELTDAQAEAILNMRLRSLRKLEEMELRREHEALSAEQADLADLLGDEERRRKALIWEVQQLKKEFGPETPLGRRRTELGEVPSDVVVPLEAVIEREPITVLISAKGWIRALKGHVEDVSEAKHKEGDKARFALRAHTTDKLLLFATNGRFYTLGCDRLPGGRGFGEPVRLSIDLPNDQDIVEPLIYGAGGGEEQRLLVAASDGRGFVVPQREVIAQTKNGKQVLNLAPGAEAAVCRPIGEADDHVAVIGENRKLLIFPLVELPEMSRGRGNQLQKYRDGGLSDAKTLRLADGLTWAAGPGRIRTETELADWLGRRAQAGRLAMRGFAASNRFD